MHAIIQQVCSHLRRHIANQVRYVYPTIMREYEYDEKAMELGAEMMEDEESFAMIRDSDMCSQRNITKLALDIGLENVYSNDAWLDPVAAYIIHYHADCRVVWDKVQQLGLLSKQL